MSGRPDMGIGITGCRAGVQSAVVVKTASKDFYPGAAYAQVRAVKLYNPNLSLYGMSTPDDFWSALSSSRNADGFLPRFILFNVDGAKPVRCVPKLSSGDPPASLIETSRTIYQAVY